MQEQLSTDAVSMFAEVAEMLPVEIGARSVKYQSRDGKHLMTRSEYKVFESAEAEKAIARETQRDVPRR